jgi:SAM-dependent methyltransferase
MTWGNTHHQRINAILPHISFERNVVDFGCGELIYAKKILPKLKDGLKYFAIDVDEDVAAHVSKIEYRFKNEIIYSNDIPNDLNENFEVIMTEVLEHVGIEEGKKIIETFLSNPFCKKIIVTTPNKDFNIHYLMKDDEVRRYDHVEELTGGELLKFVGNIFFKTNDKTFLRYLDIGDTYLGINPTQGFVIAKK